MLEEREEGIVAVCDKCAWESEAKESQESAQKALNAHARYFQEKKGPLPPLKGTLINIVLEKGSEEKVEKSEEWVDFKRRKSEKHVVLGLPLCRGPL